MRCGLAVVEEKDTDPVVLVIEDDTRLLRALSYFLSQKGLHVEQATDGQAGLDAFHSHHPDIIVIDNSLPEMMGYEVCRQVRQDEAGTDLPVIMISAYMKVLGVDSEEETLVDRFLRKPFQLEQLWNVISDMRQGDVFVRPDSRHSASRLRVAKPEDQSAFPTVGDCRETPFLELLSRALRLQTTGILTLREGQRIRRLYFANGFPVFARSNLIQESLLRYLLREGRINNETYRKHFHQIKEERWRPGVSLVREGIVSLTELNRSHRSLIARIVTRCFGWYGATFEYQSSQVPVEQAVVYDINPFQLLDTFLEEHLDQATLFSRLQLFLHGHVRSTPALESWRHMLSWAFEHDPHLEATLKKGCDTVELFGADESLREARARKIQTFALMQIVEITDPSERLALKPPQIIEQLRRLPEVHASDSSHLGASDPGTSSPGSSIPPKPESLVSFVEPSSQSRSRKTKAPSSKVSSSDVKKSQLQRIYDVVLRDYRRAVEYTSPYDVLRVSNSDTIEVIRRRFERFERFYRPENFQRLSDSKLYKLAIEIRQIMARAMADIEGDSNATSSVTNRPILRSDSNEHSEAMDPLAQIFFNDALTYLRIADYEEAKYHFDRACSIIPNHATYLAYIIWTDFLKAGRNPTAAAAAKLELQNLIKHHPGNDTAYHFLAHIFREEGRLDMAIRFYQRASDLNPSNRSAALFLERLSEN